MNIDILLQSLLWILWAIYLEMELRGHMVIRWKRLLRVPWTAGRSNQSILKEISPGCSLEGLLLKLKLILWPPDAKSWLIWKDPYAGKDWGQEEKGTTEAEMVGWHHWHNAQEFEWTLGVGDGQGGLACCGSWSRKKSRHNWPTEVNWNYRGNKPIRKEFQGHYTAKPMPRKMHSNI